MSFILQNYEVDFEFSIIIETIFYKKLFQKVLNRIVAGRGIGGKY